MKNITQPIGYIKGEGAGPDTIKAALLVLKTIEKIKKIKFRLIEYNGKAPALKYTKDSYDQLKNFYHQIHEEKGCIIRGGIYARQVYKLRHDFHSTYKPILIDPMPELFENSPFKKNFASKLNLLILRENAQGLLMSKEKLRIQNGNRKFEGKFYYDERLCKYFVDMCYKAAQERNKKIMFLIKGDVWNRKNFGGMWLNLWQNLNKKYSDVEFDWEHEDTWFGNFLNHPEQYSTVAALGIAADLITDPIAVLAYGTRAVTPSANIAPDGFMTFQTIHGAGTNIPRGKANPIAMIRTLGLMMDYFYKMPEMRNLIDKSIRKVLFKGYGTMDIYIKNNKKHKLVGTKIMTDLIINEMLR
ncbi:MAG: isocitrate/isopropylmalate family dehydrogenase [Patescibacteria group bacterium]